MQRIEYCINWSLISYNSYARRLSSATEHKAHLTSANMFKTCWTVQCIECSQHYMVILHTQQCVPTAHRCVLPPSEHVWSIFQPLAVLWSALRYPSVSDRFARVDPKRCDNRRVECWTMRSCREEATSLVELWCCYCCWWWNCTAGHVVPEAQQVPLQQNNAATYNTGQF